RSRRSWGTSPTPRRTRAPRSATSTSRSTSARSPPRSTTRRRPVPRLRLRSEEGMTLVELAISLVVVAVVLTMVMVVLVGMEKIYAKENDRTQTNNQARLAVEELDREIRSGNVLYDPANESDAANDVYPGMSLRIYTQSNAN